MLRAAAPRAFLAARSVSCTPALYLARHHETAHNHHLYEQMRRDAIAHPESFWKQQSSRITWTKQPETVRFLL